VTAPTGSLVVDASFAGAWILPDERSAEAERLLEIVLRGSLSLSVPDLWIYEMLNLLLQAARRGRIPQQAVDQGFSLVQRVPVTAFDLSTPLSRTRVLKLAHRFSLSAYDASYLELADRLQAPLVTLDGTLKKAGRTLGLPDLPAF